jgi:hypothetical protein
VGSKRVDREKEGGRDGERERFIDIRENWAEEGLEVTRPFLSLSQTVDVENGL